MTSNKCCCLTVSVYLAHCLQRPTCRLTEMLPLKLLAWICKSENTWIWLSLAQGVTRLVGTKISQWTNESPYWLHCFLSLAHHRLICPFHFHLLLFVLSVCARPFVSLAAKILNCWCPSIMEITSSDRKVTAAHFSAPVSLHYRADPIRTRRCAHKVMYESQLMTWNTEKEVQGDFPQALLTRSVTPAEFLASFCRLISQSGLLKVKYTAYFCLAFIRSVLWWLAVNYRPHFSRLCRFCFSWISQVYTSVGHKHAAAAQMEWTHVKSD